ncbi:conserved hypothetical protein [Histoplasma capsulatum G186AR]|uniref:Uncharacterized protein n=1 Tax=Ajellomyces capsulatus (strain G186AR / H82 / ATCC MYA-2454 / RMSCC 2432) TaxID=447093 RepID=C0NGT5_AJECG|nr:uncharacterized protein HCBG_02557 [Histoplasma capsulatum G186AR]EEH09020.1 conserved hypothetical protein [Histoplasma capsulatum G186AR]
MHHSIQGTWSRGIHMYPSPFEDVLKMALIGLIFAADALYKRRIYQDSSRAQIPDDCYLLLCLFVNRNDEAEISYIPVAYACKQTCSGSTQIKVGRNHIEMSAVLYLSVEEIVA